MTHDDTTLQAAIDAAFLTNGDNYSASLVTSKHTIYWPDEAPARLAVAKSFLAALPTAEQSAEKAEADSAVPRPSLSRLRPLTEAGPSIREALNAIPVYPPKAEPETFEAHGKTWTRHKPGDPCPVHADAVVYVLTSKKSEASESAARYCAWQYTEKDNAWWGVIIGWRYADESEAEPAQPWTPAVGDVVRLTAEQNSSGVRFSEREMRIMDIALRMQQEYEQLFLEVKDLKKQLTNLKTQKP